MNNVNCKDKEDLVRRLEPYWEDLWLLETGGLCAHLRIHLKYGFRFKSFKEIDFRQGSITIKSALNLLVEDMMPDIRAFFESEGGRKEYQAWLKEREKCAEAEKKDKKAS